MPLRHSYAVVVRGNGAARPGNAREQGLSSVDDFLCIDLHMISVCWHDVTTVETISRGLGGHRVGEVSM